MNSDPTITISCDYLVELSSARVEVWYHPHGEK